MCINLVLRNDDLKLSYLNYKRELFLKKLPIQLLAPEPKGMSK